MSIISKMRKQKAVWWQRSSTPNSHGRYSYEEPVEIDCRWDDAMQEFVGSAGEVLTSKSVVYPDRELAPGDMLQEGEIDSNTPTDPREEDGPALVRGTAKTPNLRATETLYTAYL